MPRPHKPRWIGLQPSGVSFVPHPGIPPGPDVAMLTVDELEALRLADAEGLSQEEGAAQMQVSRATFGRIVGRARSKVAHALVNGRPIGIDGGEVRFHPPASGGRHGGGRGAGRGHGRGRRGHGSQHTQGGQ